MTPNPNLRDLGAAVEALRTMPDDRFDSHQRTAEALATLDVVLQLEARARADIAVYLEGILGLDDVVSGVHRPYLDQIQKQARQLLGA